MNMEQRAARHAEMHKQEGLLPHAGAHGEDVEAERPLFAAKKSRRKCARPAAATSAP